MIFRLKESCTVNRISYYLTFDNSVVLSDWIFRSDIHTTDFKCTLQETEKQRINYSEKNVETNFHELNSTKTILVSLFAYEEGQLRSHSHLVFLYPLG